MKALALKVIDRLSREKRVEQIASNITHYSFDAPQLQDLAQLVYLTLLEYDSSKIVELEEKGQINFFIVRIIVNQYRSKNSTYYYLFRKFLNQSNELTGQIDVIDKSTLTE